MPRLLNDERKLLEDLAILEAGANTKEEAGEEGILWGMMENRGHSSELISRALKKGWVRVGDHPKTAPGEPGAVRYALNLENDKASEVYTKIRVKSGHNQ